MFIRLGFNIISLINFMILCRLKFLLYSPILYTIGTIIAEIENNDDLNVYNYFIGIIFILNTHIMTHLYNEFYDIDSDRINKNPSPWTGGSRVLALNLLPIKVSLIAGHITLMISIILVCMMTNFSSIYLSLLIVFLAHAYSSPPLKLETRGLGEFTVMLVLNIMVPLLGFTQQAGDLVINKLFVILIPLAIIEFVRMMIMNIPDIEPDALTNKRTLVVRIGPKKTAIFYSVGIILSYILLLLMYFFNFPLLIIFLLLSTAPLGLWIAYRLIRGDWKSTSKLWNLPFWASTHNGFVAALALLGLIWHFNQKKFFTIESLPLWIYFIVFIFLQINNSKYLYYKNNINSSF